MPAFGNPVIGHIYAKGESHPAGTFRVTSTFADHVASRRAAGIDIGNGACGAAVLAACSGKISLVVPGKVGSTASIDSSIVRIRRPDGWEFGVAHLKVALGLAVGQSISEGTPIGACDKIGASACHVHFGVKDPSGVEVDPWPMLRQNGATEDDVLQGANPQRIVNRQTSVKGDNTRFRSSPFVRSDNELTKYAAGTAFYPDWSVEGTTVGTSKRWYGGWGNVGAAKEFGYMHESVLSGLVPIEQSGHSDEELAAARSDGIADAAAAAGAVK